MSKFLLSLMAIVFMSISINAQERFTSSDWEFVGKQHNEQLEDVYNYIKNNPSIRKKGIIEDITKYMIDKVNKSSESKGVKEQTVINIEKNAYAFGTLKNLYPDAALAKSLSAIEKQYLDDLFSIVIDDKLSASNIQSKVERLESEIDNNTSLNNTQLATLYSATNTAKFSAEYWENNTEKWAILGGNANRATSCCMDGVLGADAGGAVTAALATWAVNAAPGAGQVAYGTAIVGGAASASLGKAVENLWNHWF